MVSIPNIPSISIPNISLPNIGGLAPSVSAHSSRPSGVTTSIFGLVNVISVIVMVLIGRGNLGVGIFWFPLAIVAFDVVAISLLDFRSRTELIGVFFTLLNVIGIAVLVSSTVLQLTLIAFVAIIAIVGIFELPNRVTIKP